MNEGPVRFGQPFAQGRSPDELHERRALEDRPEGRAARRDHPRRRRARSTAAFAAAATPSKPPPIRSAAGPKPAPPYSPAPPPAHAKRSSGRVYAASDVGADGERDSQARKRAKMTFVSRTILVARPQDEITLPLVAPHDDRTAAPHLSADDTELPSDELRCARPRRSPALTQTDRAPCRTTGAMAAGVDFVLKEAG